MKKFALLALGIFALGCGGAGAFLENGPVVRLVSAFGGENVNGSIAAQTLVNGTGFGTAGVGRFMAGTERVLFTRAVTNEVLIDQLATFEDGKDYTLIGFNGGLLRLQEEFTPSPTNAAVRFAQTAGPAHPVVDIYTGAVDSDVANATLLHDNLSSGTATSFQNYPENTKIFVTQPNDRTVIFEGNVGLDDARHYTLIVGMDGTMKLVTIIED